MIFLKFKFLPGAIIVTALIGRQKKKPTHVTVWIVHCVKVARYKFNASAM
jgi:hypothetical protein